MLYHALIVALSPAGPREEFAGGMDMATEAVRGGRRAITERQPDARTTFRDGALAIAAAVGLALLVPAAILLVGLPVALAVRAIAELVGWLIAAAS